MSNDELPTTDYLYGGVTGVALAAESFALGEGIELRGTYSHLFSASMMAFARPAAGGPHPGPWKAAKGGFAYDIDVEIRVPITTRLGPQFAGRETVWWIAALLRLAAFPYLTVPVISDLSFRDIPHSLIEPTLTPFEVESRILTPANDDDRVVKEEHLEWIGRVWRPGADLLTQKPTFYSALKAFDSATVRGRSSASMLALWGAIEQLFAPSAGELRFRVAALLASYLEGPGATRLDLYRKILRLYNERSLAAHTANEVETGALVETYVIMRNALVRMIDTGDVPTQPLLESLLFNPDFTSLRPS